MANKIVFFSRHTLTEEQIKGLFELNLPTDNDVAWDPAVVLTVNATFPARAEEASAEIMAKAKELGAEYIAGVFPAHVAIELYRDLGVDDNPMFMLVPVSVPAPAVEGEVRGGGFVYSHWELFTAE